MADQGSRRNKIFRVGGGKGGGDKFCLPGGGIRGLQVIFVLVRRGAIFAKCIINNLNFPGGPCPL